MLRSRREKCAAKWSEGVTMKMVGLGARWHAGGGVSTDYALLLGSLALGIVAICWLLFVGTQGYCQATPVPC
jgi:hypothetical protein